MLSCYQKNGVKVETRLLANVCVCPPESAVPFIPHLLQSSLPLDHDLQLRGCPASVCHLLGRVTCQSQAIPHAALALGDREGTRSKSGTAHAVRSPADAEVWPGLLLTGSLFCASMRANKKVHFQGPVTVG